MNNLPIEPNLEHVTGHVNPLRRLRNQLNLTQQELADSLTPPISQIAVLRYEQALYQHPSERIVAFLAQATGTPETTIIQEYLEFQHSQRTYYARAFDYGIECVQRDLAGNQEDRTSIEVFLRGTMIAAGLTYSRVGFAKLLAIHPDIVAKYEQTGKMPAGFRKALLDALPPYKVDYLRIVTDG